MHGAENRTIALERKIPVYIVYFTAYSRDGQLYFADDLYGRDEALEDQMADTVAKKSAQRNSARGQARIPSAPA